VAEDTPSLLDEVLLASRRPTACAVCEWITAQDNSEEWDRIMALPWKEANSKAIHRAMVKRGFERGDKTIQDHRQRSHRVPA
jgi:hypothetical protein